MKIVITYTAEDAFLADAIDQTIRRLLPKARRGEPPETSGYYHIIYRTTKKGRKEIMSKIHVDRMAAAVKKYYSESQIAAEKMRRNNETYIKEAADKENERIKQQLQTVRQAAEEAIAAAQESGKNEALKWGELDGSKITEDARLLDFDISPEQYSKLVEKHRTNGTMLSLLKNYGDRQNEKYRQKEGKTGEMPKVYYPSGDIPTAEKKAEVYDKFAAGALNLLSNIDATGRIGTGPDSVMLKAAVENFGQPVGNAANLLEMV